MDIHKIVESTIEQLGYLKGMVHHVCYWGIPHKEVQLILKPWARADILDLNVLRDIFQTDKIEVRETNNSTASIWLRY